MVGHYLCHYLSAFPGNGIQFSTCNVIHSVARHNPHLRDGPGDEFVYFRGYGEADCHQDGIYQKSIERKKELHSMYPVFVVFVTTQSVTQCLNKWLPTL